MTDSDPDLRLLRLTGASSLTAAMEIVERWNASHLELLRRSAEAERVRTLIDRADRASVLADLRALRVQAPASACLEALGLLADAVRSERGLPRKWGWLLGRTAERVSTGLVVHVEEAEVETATGAVDVGPDDDDEGEDHEDDDQD